jgi:KUP system potassium uptake protein
MSKAAASILVGAPPPTFGRTAALTLGALGVVFGDIGTSPIYAMRETVRATGGAMPGSLAVLGALSAIIWALILVVTVK